MKKDLSSAVVLTKGQIKRREKKRSRKFAIELMKILGVKQAIPYYRKGEVLKSCTMGNLRSLDSEETEVVKKLETDYNFHIYHVVESLGNFSGAQLKMVHYLGVNMDLYFELLGYGLTEEEVIEELECDIKWRLEQAIDGAAYTYTVNKTWNISEFGTVGFAFSSNGLERMY